MVTIIWLNLQSDMLLFLLFDIIGRSGKSSALLVKCLFILIVP